MSEEFEKWYNEKYPHNNLSHPEIDAKHKSIIHEAYKAGAKERLERLTVDELTLYHDTLRVAVHSLIQGCITGKGKEALAEWDAMRSKEL